MFQNLLMIFEVFFCAASAQLGPRPLHFSDFKITHYQTTTLGMTPLDE
jgi:hypothetical protein